MDTEDEIKYLILPHDSVCHRAASLCPDCILILRLPPAKGAGFNNNNNKTTTAAKLLLGQWGGGGGDGWKKKKKVCSCDSGKKRNEKKERVEKKPGDVGQKVLKSGCGGQVIQQQAENRPISLSAFFLLSSLSLSISLSLSLSVWYDLFNHY